MVRLIKQSFSGSISIKNYQGSSVMGRFRDKEEAQSKADIILKQAQKEGYTVVDYSYFAKDRSCSFSLYLVPEEDAPITWNWKKGDGLNAR